MQYTVDIKTNMVIFHKKSRMQHNQLQYDTIQQKHIDGFVQDSSNFSALAVVWLQSCTNPSILHIYGDREGNLIDKFQ